MRLIADLTNGINQQGHVSRVDRSDSRRDLAVRVDAVSHYASF